MPTITAAPQATASSDGDSGTQLGAGPVSGEGVSVPPSL